MQWDYLIKQSSFLVLALALASGVLYEWTGWLRYRTAALVLAPVGVGTVILSAFLWGVTESNEEPPESRLALLGSLLWLAAVGLYVVGAALAAVPGQPPYTITLTTTTLDTLVTHAAWATLVGLVGILLGLAVTGDWRDPAPAADAPPDDPTEMLEEDD